MLRIVSVTLCLYHTVLAYPELVIDTSKNFLYNSPFYSEDTGLLIHKEMEQRVSAYRFYWEDDFYLLFRYRDTTFFDVWQKALLDKPDNTIVRIWFLNALTQSGDSRHMKLLLPYLSDGNSILREMAVNGIGFLGEEKDTVLIDSLLAKEKNWFVRETLKSSRGVLKNGGLKNAIDYLPQYYADTPVKLKFFYNTRVLSSAEFYYKRVDSSRALSNEIIPADTILHPHQQYGIPIKYSQGYQGAGAFGNEHGPLIHVGRDTGWLLQGLPVHAISDGVVRLVQHELSWGTMIVIESKTKTGKPFCVIYGHLSRLLNVKPGQVVHAGDKIGQIGNSVSYENGGYWAHLHLGIEKSDFKTAMLGGYSVFSEPYTTVEGLREFNTAGNTK